MVRTEISGSSKVQILNDPFCKKKNYDFFVGKLVSDFFGEILVHITVVVKPSRRSVN